MMRPSLDAALDAEGRGVLADGVKLLFHRERDLHRPPHDQGERRRERFQLDIDLCPEAAAEERHAHADAVFRPAQQAGNLRTHE